MTLRHAVRIFGNAPPFNPLTYTCAKRARAGPLIYCPSTVLNGAASWTRLQIALTWFLNSARNRCKGSSERLRSFASSLTGLTRVMQSRFLKICVSAWRIWFACCCRVLCVFLALRPFSRYSRGVIALPSSSSSAKAKSLSTHSSEGKPVNSAAAPLSSLGLLPSADAWMCSAKCTTSSSCSIVVFEMHPVVLRMSMEERRAQRANT
mmetsp:Transcript_7962/g.15365  ORF Transcript_7962/g.15365 Transcript_7962/m.15365 type:complete len:207 (+) Transcript_7962:1072-1692(+)